MSQTVANFNIERRIRKTFPPPLLVKHSGCIYLMCVCFLLFPSGLSHLVGSSLLRAYMHGYFMDIRLYHKVRVKKTRCVSKGEKKKGGCRFGFDGRPCLCVAAGEEHGQSFCVRRVPQRQDPPEDRGVQDAESAGQGTMSLSLLCNTQVKCNVLSRPEMDRCLHVTSQRSINSQGYQPGHKVQSKPTVKMSNVVWICCHIETVCLQLALMSCSSCFCVRA